MSDSLSLDLPHCAAIKEATHCQRPQGRAPGDSDWALGEPAQSERVIREGFQEEAAPGEARAYWERSRKGIATGRQQEPRCGPREAPWAVGAGGLRNTVVATQMAEQKEHSGKRNRGLREPASPCHKPGVSGQSPLHSPKLGFLVSKMVTGMENTAALGGGGPRPPRPGLHARPRSPHPSPWAPHAEAQTGSEGIPGRQVTSSGKD